MAIKFTTSFVSQMKFRTFKKGKIPRTGVTTFGRLLGHREYQLLKHTRFWLLQLLLVSPKRDDWTPTLYVANIAVSHIHFYMTEFAKDGAGERWPPSHFYLPNDVTVLQCGGI